MSANPRDVANESAQGNFGPLDTALADWARRHGGDEQIAQAFALVSRAVQQGHSCLNLDASHPLPGSDKTVSGRALLKAVRTSSLAGGPGDEKPLILEDTRLYFHRYWQYEQRLANRIRRFIESAAEPVSLPTLLADGGLFDFASVTTGQPHWQAVAAFTALRHRFAIISGGPGTGKTFTVLRLMVLLIRAALEAGQRAPLIKIAAPTGKAAARMAESVITGVGKLNIPDDVRAHIPTEASTLHRLLGLGFGTTRPRYDAENTLPADIVIVDEASMVDLSLMAKLAEAVRESARLILLGDRYQLASVEAGSVLSELCQAAGVNAFSTAHIAAGGALLADVESGVPSLLGDHVVTLQTSHRFNAESGIGRLATAINDGDTERSIALLREGLPHVTWLDNPDASRTSLLDEYAAYRAARIDILDPAQALDVLRSRVILCAVREGPFGSNTINREITLRVARARGFDSTRIWYHGRPVIVLRNDYRVGLFNGDAGVCLRDRDGQFRVWFRTDEGLRALLPPNLPEHTTLYAMTIHKSQGSEFERVAMVLPTVQSEVLSRELLYTGITRARQSVELISYEEILRITVSRQIQRYSGLAARLQTEDGAR